MEKTGREFRRNHDDVMKYCRRFSAVIDESPKEECVSVLFALVTQTMSFMAQMKTFTITDKEDGLERMVLDWINTADTVVPFHFSKYIKKKLL